MALRGLDQYGRKSEQLDAVYMWAGTDGLNKRSSLLALPDCRKCEATPCTDLAVGPVKQAAAIFLLAPRYDA
jgi:hypothetical protein